MPRTGGVYSPPAGTKGVPNTTIQSVPYNTLIDDLTADANAARPITAGGTGATSASAARTALGLAIGTNVQAYDAGLQSIAGLVTVADQMIYTTALDVYATTALTPFARTLLDDANASTALTTLGVSTFMKTVLDDADAATARTTLGLTDNEIARYVLQSFGNYVPSGQNFNNLVEGDRGLYGTASATGAPPASGVSFWYVENKKMYGSSVIMQTAVGYHNGAPGDPIIWKRFRGADGTTWGTWRRLLTTADAGSGSGLDADLLDGQHGAYYLNAANLTGTVADARLPSSMSGKTFTGQVVMTQGLTLNPLSGNSFIYFNENDVNRGLIYNDDAADRLIFRKYSTTGVNEAELAIWGSDNNDLKFKGNTVWHAGNDGSGSGLDADTVDGVHLAGLVQTSRTITAGNGLTGGGDLSANRTITLGTPTSISGSSTNSVTTTSHAHELLLVSADITGALGYTPASTGRSIIAGNGLTGGGNLTADRTLAVGQGTGITVAATTVSVDATVWRDGNQPTAAQIGSLYAGNAQGTIGTYAFALKKTAGTINPGSTVAGTDLYWSNSANSAVLGLDVGTWRAMGVITNTSASLALRIS